MTKGRSDLIFGTDPDHIRYTKKKFLHFQKSHFQCIFNDFGFKVDIKPKVMSIAS